MANRVTALENPPDPHGKTVIYVKSGRPMCDRNCIVLQRTIPDLGEQTLFA